MAADASHAKNVTHTLVPATAAKLQLTGPGRVLELVHHSNVTNVCYFNVFSTEAGITTVTGGGAEGEQVLLPGERLQVNTPQRRAPSETVWVSIISAGAAVVSVNILQAGE